MGIRNPHAMWLATQAHGTHAKPTLNKTKTLVVAGASKSILWCTEH